MSKRMYRIGVDARLLCDDQVTGIGYYCHELLSHLISTGYEWILYANQPILVGDWQQDNVKQSIAPFPGELMRQIWAQSALPLSANRDQLDLFWSPTHRMPNFLSAKIARVVTIHDLVWKHAGDTMRPSRRLVDKTLMPQAVRIADRIMTDSKCTQRDLHEEFPATRDKTRTVYLGKPPRSTASHESPLGLPKNYFLFVGTLEPRKNLERLLEAYAKLPERLQKYASLVIIGGKGWGNIDLTSLIEKNAIAERVKVLGYVEREKMSAIYANALFLAMPSLHEGFGLPLLEAMVEGTPVLTSNCSSLPEITGDAGLLVNPLDVNDISKGLKTLLENESLRETLKQKSLVQADKFCWEKTATETLKVFDEAIATRQKVRSRI